MVPLLLIETPVAMGSTVTALVVKPVRIDPVEVTVRLSVAVSTQPLVTAPLMLLLLSGQASGAGAASEAGEAAASTEVIAQLISVRFHAELGVVAVIMLSLFPFPLLKMLQIIDYFYCYA
jgi:hypothetical protein